jgi:hypothetical protein
MMMARLVEARTARLSLEILISDEARPMQCHDACWSRAMGGADAVSAACGLLRGIVV